MHPPSCAPVEPERDSPSVRIECRHTEQPLWLVRFSAPYDALAEHVRHALSALEESLVLSAAQTSGLPFVALHRACSSHLELAAGVPLVQPAPSKGRVEAASMPLGRYLTVEPCGTVMQGARRLEHWLEANAGETMIGPVYLLLADAAEGCAVRARVTTGIEQPGSMQPAARIAAMRRLAAAVSALSSATARPARSALRDWVALVGPVVGEARG